MVRVFNVKLLNIIKEQLLFFIENHEENAAEIPLSSEYSLKTPKPSHDQVCASLWMPLGNETSSYSFLNFAFE